jgi:hypothetical protein
MASRLTDPLGVIECDWWQSVFDDEGALASDITAWKEGDLGAEAFEAIFGVSDTFDAPNGLLPWKRKAEWWQFDFKAHAVTAPEYVMSILNGGVRRALVREPRDHEVLAIMAAHLLLTDTEAARAIGSPGLAKLPPYEGRPSPPLPSDPRAVIRHGRRGSVLRAQDVRGALPRFALAWRALRASEGAVAVKARPLSRWQVSPWCGLNEDKAVAFVAWLEENGVIESEPLETRYGLEARAYQLAAI